LSGQQAYGLVVFLLAFVAIAGFSSSEGSILLVLVGMPTQGFTD
jgi:hypothetical protein